MSARLAARDRQPAAVALLMAPLVVLAAFWVYLLSGAGINLGRPDFYYLADAFLHGRTWMAVTYPWDAIVIDGRTYVPFGPFPAFVVAS